MPMSQVAHGPCQPVAHQLTDEVMSSYCALAGETLQLGHLIGNHENDDGLMMFISLVHGDVFISLVNVLC